MVNRPIRGKDIVVTLTAFITKDSRQYTKMFKFIVKSIDPEYTGDIEPENIAYMDYSLQDKEKTNVFSDVTSSYWAKNYIEYLYNEGIIKGTNEGKFEPNRKNVTLEDGPVAEPGNLAFINKVGTLRKGHSLLRNQRKSLKTKIEN